MRRRQNVRTVVRTSCAAVAVGASVLAALVALALTTSERVFTAACAILATLLLAATGWLLVRAGRDWLAKGRAPSWIDRSAGLEGRLATLLALRHRDGDAFFLPLLEEENRRRLACWEPRRLVPRRVPRGALVAAIVALTALASVVALAPGLAPAPRQAARDDDEVMHAVPVRPGDATTRVASIGTDATPEQTQEQTPEQLAPTPGAEAAREPEPGTLARALQERIRRELWGEEPRTENARRPYGKGAPGEARDDDASEDSWQIAQGGTPGDRRARARGAPEAPVPRAQLEAAGDEGRDDSARAPADGEEHPAGGGGGGASGAGTGTDPNLFGQAHAPDDAPSGRFELGIVARVRTHRAAPRPPTGEPPPASPDERPVLGARQRQEVAVRRMIVPPAYEPIVRRMFAHATEDK